MATRTHSNVARTLGDMSSFIGHGYDETAGRYDDAASRNAQGAARLIEALPDLAVDTILDAGCGTGFATMCALERFDAERVVGVDLSAEMIDLFAAKLDQRGVAGDLRVADITSVDLPPDAADLAICSMALHWISDRAGAKPRPPGAINISLPSNISTGNPRPNGPRIPN